MSAGTFLAQSDASGLKLVYELLLLRVGQGAEAVKEGLLEFCDVFNAKGLRNARHVGIQTRKANVQWLAFFGGPCRYDLLQEMGPAA